MRRWKRLFHLSGVEDQIDWEIRHHLQERVDDLVARGLTPAEAEREARRAFGDLSRVRAEMRSESRGRTRRTRARLGVHGLGQDIRQAARRLRNRPGFTLVAILVLGLGIGANTAVFTVLEAALLARPPYPQPERLVMVDLLASTGAAAAADATRGAGIGASGEPMPWSYPKFDLARRHFRALESVAGYWPSTLTLTGSGQARRIGVEFVSPSYFDVLGVRPTRGRAFGDAEDGTDGGAVVLLAEGFWRASFGADAAVVGRTITLDGAALEVIGVIPAGFGGLSGSADVWVPFAGITAIRGPRRLRLPSAHWINVVARLRPGVTLEAARQDAVAASGALVEAFPPREDWEPRAIGIEPLLAARVNPVTRLAISVVSLAAALLLLIACANVAGLLLVRASARRTELAVRAALGAGRGRLVRESLIETALLALAGGVFGALLALSGRHLIATAVRYALDTSGTRQLQFLDPGALAVDGSVLAVGLLVAVGTTLGFGLLPALVAARPSITAGLHGGGRGGEGRVPDRSGMVRGALVAGQLALTLVLLCGTGLMAASLARLSAITIGFENRNVLSVSFARGLNTTPEQDAQFDRSLLERAGALPGVRAAAIAPCPPLTAPCEIAGVRQIDDTPLPPDAENAAAIAYGVSDDYFRALGIPVRSGATFDAEHGPGAPPVVVISESAAERFFPGRSAIGRRIAITHFVTEERPAIVIGIVADVQYDALEAPMMPTVYLSRRQAPSSYGALFLHTSGDPSALMDAVRREFAGLDPDVPLTDVAMLSDLHGIATARTRTVLGLLASFALLGLLLSATGLYGIVSYAVVRRTREMGVRIALGAPTRAVLGLVMRSSAVLTATGAAAGLLAALALTRYAHDLLFGVSTFDPLVLGGAVLVMFAVGAVAAWVPARRALRVNPASALRAE
jgi:predicted permease